MRLALFIAGCVLIPVWAQQGGANHTADAVNTLRVYYASHSLMWYVPASLSQLAAAAGLRGHEVAGVQRIGASRTLQHWEKAEPNDAKAALRKGNVDVFVMSPIQFPDEGVEAFVKLGLEHNPGMRFLVQLSWGGGDTDNQDFPKGSWDRVDRNKTPEQLNALYARNIRAGEAQADAINRRYGQGRQIMALVPSAQALVELRTRIYEKRVPGLNRQEELFVDAAHPSPPLEALNTYLHYAVLYGRSPVGLPRAGTLQAAGRKEWDEALSRTLQEIAWETASRYAYSGIAALKPGGIDQVIIGNASAVAGADTGLPSDGTLTIDAAEPVAQTSPRLYGLMTEEINYAYDGGLYAELVRNRAFRDDPASPVHWSAVQPAGASVALALDATQPLNAAVPASLRLDVSAASATALAGVANEGYFGIPVMPRTRYRAVFYAKAASESSGPLVVSLAGRDGAALYATARTPKLTTAWKRYELNLETAENLAPSAQARLVLGVERPGTRWLGYVSLFPPTWKDRPNGCRPDLMRMLIDLRPKFLRFPGGNYLEGDTIQTRFDWKKTLGPVEERPGHPCPWGYRSSDGMGLLEFLLWCEDMGAEPVLGVYAGYSLKGEVVKPGPDLAPFVQDALDEIEYVAGPTNTVWGARRAQDGHPAPFPLHYVEIGNEDWFDKTLSYDARFVQLVDAIKARHPALKCISTVGNEQPADKRVHSRRPDVLDEHYYRQAKDFLKDAATRFEGYDRKGPEIFVGEWAAHETPFPPWDERSRSEPPTPNMAAALGDAAWLAAMERNSDVVTMQCYAPLLVNINGRQWRPNLIGYDALRAYGAPSYYAFQLFSRRVGDEILRAVFDRPVPLHVSATRERTDGTVIVKLVNPDPAPQRLTILLQGGAVPAPRATALTLAAAPEATNTIDQPTRVVPVASYVDGVAPRFTYLVPPASVVVLYLSCPLGSAPVPTADVSHEKPR